MWCARMWFLMIISQLHGRSFSFNTYLCCNTCVMPSGGKHTVWREIFAGQNFRGLATGKDFAKKFSRFDDHKAHSTHDDHKISRLKFSRSEAIRENRENWYLLCSPRFMPDDVMLTSVVCRYLLCSPRFMPDDVILTSAVCPVYIASASQVLNDTYIWQGPTR